MINRGEIVRLLKQVGDDKKNKKTTYTFTLPVAW